MSGTLEFNLHYELLEQIGMGAFGQVFKAVDTRTNEVCAVKVVDLETAGDELDDVQQVRVCAVQCDRSLCLESSRLAGVWYQEIKVLSQCACEQLTKYIGSFIVGTKLW